MVVEYSVFPQFFQVIVDTILRSFFAVLFVVN